MSTQTLSVTQSDGTVMDIPVTRVHTLVIGSGAAGLNAAVQLRANGIEDVVIVTEGLRLGTSINTGSDKQTYYKLSMCGEEADSPVAMARTYFDGGSMHGDLGLVEASLSARAFINLVNIGVPFPRDAYGQFIGYKTDHDPRQRATSIGPYTSREMCRALIRTVKALRVPILERRHVVKLLVIDDPPHGRRAAGAVAVQPDGSFEVFTAADVVLAVGGPGGLYKASVYPEVHTGAIGLALLEGAAAQGLPESQYGMASTQFRWNVSGTYMQVIPRFISTADDGVTDEREFLAEYYADAGRMNSDVFLKGYQWPFDSRKAIGGSSLVDILVYIETVVRGRRVFLDYRANPAGFSFEALSDEARQYLEKSGALQDLPIERLEKMNPGAVELYLEHGIDITSEPLEIAVCAQHNNGGLAANHWWESTNIKHLFPVGEVNGSHGVYRPGGSALNSGQVGGFRAAEFIAHRYADGHIDDTAARQAAAEAVAELLGKTQPCAGARPWRAEREEFQARMSRAGAHIRSLDTIDAAVGEAWQQWHRIDRQGCLAESAEDRAEVLKTRYLCFAHAVYLEAVRFAMRSGTGSRGSAVVLDAAGAAIHPALGKEWHIRKEDEGFREKVLETTAAVDGIVAHAWKPRRPLPDSETWFETAWARFREGRIYEDPPANGKP